MHATSLAPSKSLTLKRVLQVADSLPCAPRVLAELNALLQDANNGLEQVAALLRLDSSLTSGVIRIANGIVYNQGELVASLEEALSRVGFNEVYRLVGMASVTQLMNFQLRFYGVSAQRLRENALFVALLMEDLAPHAGLNARTAYTAGLLRSVGCVALDATAQRDLRYLRPSPVPRDGLMTWEVNHFGLTSPAVGDALLQTWHFSYEIYVLIRDHYLQGLAMEPLPGVRLLNLAASAAEARQLGLNGEAGYWARPGAKLAQLGLTEASFAQIVERVTGRFEHLRAALA